MYKRLFLLIVMMFLVIAAPLTTHSQEAIAYTVHIFHTNDEHAHHQPDRDGNGGAARLMTLINEARETDDNVLLLDAGDRFSGTLFHVFYQGQDNVQVMNLLDYDAMTLGNHEFDNGSETLAAFINGVEFPVLAANVDVSQDPFLANLIEPYTVLEVDGERIGVIGLVTSRTAFISLPEETVKFDDDLVGVTAEAVAELEAQGINKIILLTHIGYQEDVALAQAVTGVDIVIGGHTNTIPRPYPVKLFTTTREPILVVQAGYHGLYVGSLKVTFDADGIVTDGDGSIVQINNSLADDADMVALLEELEQPVAEYTNQVIGQTAFAYPRRCNDFQCDIGSLVADAIRESTGADIAIMNVGGIRDSLPEGDVTYGDILSVLPFGNQISVFDMTYADLVETLEYGMSSPFDGKFPQVSGVSIGFNPGAPNGRRVASLLFYDDAADTWVAGDVDKIYRVATNNFMRAGGDGYEILVERAIDPYDSAGDLAQTVADYIAAHSPVDNRVDQQITITR